MEAALALKRPCPDCIHQVRTHDYLGCTLRDCNCRLTSVFLIQYFKEE